MQNLYKLFFILFIITILISSCKNTKQSSTFDEVVANAQTDEYALLSAPTEAPAKIVEDLSGRVIVIYENDFIERITAIDNPKGFQYLGKTPCIVSLYANWCKPCGVLNESLMQIAPEYQGSVIFYKLNIEKAQAVRAAFNVESIPKILYFKPFGEVHSTVGYLNQEELRKKINELLLKP